MCFIQFNYYRPHPKDGGRYCFQFVCQSTYGGGTPVRSGWGGHPIPGLAGGGTPSQVWLGGVPHPRSGWGYPPTTRSGWGTPPDLGLGTPQDLGLGTPPDMGLGTPPPPGPGTGIASTCYAAGGMPLAFTQEDFLIIVYLW